MSQDMSRGVFISLEGVDGSGKTTQARMLASRLAAAGREVLALREPGGTDISERIRSLVLDPSCEGMCAECELLLMEASRAQLVREVIQPALARGVVVICDRFFDSTTAYQAGGRGIEASLVSEANALGSCGVTPDLTVVLDLDPVQAASRMAGEEPDRMEAEGIAFQERIWRSYRELAEREPQRVCLVSADAAPDEVHAHLMDLVSHRLSLDVPRVS
jgi:dTMP kinase